MSRSFREMGIELLAEGNFERALAVFAEAVRRCPEDHRSRMLAARCFGQLGEPERAVMVLHGCAEGLLRRDALLPAIAACCQALALAPKERRIVDTLARIHARALTTVVGRTPVPPPLPPDLVHEGRVETDLTTLAGSELLNQAMAVLASPDHGSHAAPDARPPLPLFAELDRDAFVALVEQIDYRELEAGDHLCREGHGGDRITIIVAGKAEVTRLVDGTSKALASLGGGAIVGDISLLTGTPHSATVTAVTECEVLEIERADLNRLARDFPAAPQVLAAFMQMRMARSLMSSSPLFAQVPEAEWGPLLAKVSLRAVAPGEKVIIEGEPGAALVLVLAGELVVQKKDPAGGVVSLSILREGDIAGEIALVKGLPATATVSATRKTAIASLSRADFEVLLGRHAPVREFFEGLSERRLAQIGEALRASEILDADELVVEPS